MSMMTELPPKVLTMVRNLPDLEVETEVHEAPPRVAIFGTAGRDRSGHGRLMDRRLWEAMLESARELVPAGAYLISGGAAWADHLAVRLFLERHASSLMLHLPAPMYDDRYVGGPGSAGAVSRRYHTLFSNAIGEDTQAQIGTALELSDSDYTYEPVAGYAAFFARNRRIATSLISPETDFDPVRETYCWTFGTDEPGSKGSLFTWHECAKVPRCVRTHINLGAL